MSNISNETLTLAGKIADGVKIDAKSGTATVAADLYKNNLPEGLTVELVERLEGYKSTFAAAGAHALGEAGAKALSKNKDLDRVDTHVEAVGGVSFDFHQSRREEYAAPGGNGATVVKHGPISVKVTHEATKNVGDLKKVRQHVLSVAEELLAK